MELDITSLLDILVIILIFLLKNYNTSDIQINVPRDIKPAKSISQLARSMAPIVGLSNERVYLNEEVVLELSQAGKNHFDHRGMRILPLYNQLMEIKEKKEVQKMVQIDAEDSKSVNLIVDRNDPYSLLKKVMYTCQKAGLTRYKFIVYQDEKKLTSVSP